MKKGEVIIRFNAGFEIKPYFKLNIYKGFEAMFGWLWFRFNVVFFEAIK